MSNTNKHKKDGRPQQIQQFQRQRQQMRQQQQTHHNQKKTRVRPEDRIRPRECYPTLTELPHVHFPKETQGHQHVHNSDIVIAIPQGKRCLLWFTSTSSSQTSDVENTESMNRCVVIELTEHNRMGKRYPIKACFHSSLAYGSGTVVMGTFSSMTKLKTVAIHDIYTYKGHSYNNVSYSNKLLLFQTIFQYEIQQISYFPEHVVIGLPIIIPGNITHDELLTQLRSIPYTVSEAQFRYTNRNDVPIVNVSMTNMLITPVEKNTNNNNLTSVRYIDYRAIRAGKVRVPDAVFTVTPELQNDVYRLSTTSGYHGFAAIQSYNTSKFMNKLFRNIKENENLDLLEESDDEDDFENVAFDKYVDMNKTYRIVCRYLYKINKWEPYKIAERNKQVVNASEIHELGRVSH